MAINITAPQSFRSHSQLPRVAMYAEVAEPFDPGNGGSELHGVESEGREAAEYPTRSGRERVRAGDLRSVRVAGEKEAPWRDQHPEQGPGASAEMAASIRNRQNHFSTKIGQHQLQARKHSSHLKQTASKQELASPPRLPESQKAWQTSQTSLTVGSRKWLGLVSGFSRSFAAVRPLRVVAGSRAGLSAVIQTSVPSPGHPKRPEELRPLFEELPKAKTAKIAPALV